MEESRDFATKKKICNMVDMNAESSISSSSSLDTKSPGSIDTTKDDLPRESNPTNSLTVRLPGSLSLCNCCETKFQYLI